MTPLTTCKIKKQFHENCFGGPLAATLIKENLFNLQQLAKIQVIQKLNRFWHRKGGKNKPKNGQKQSPVPTNHNPEMTANNSQCNLTLRRDSPKNLRLCNYIVVKQESLIRYCLRNPRLNYR